MRMYDYSESFVKLEQMLVEGEIDKEQFDDTIESLLDGADEKAENVAKMIDNFKGQAELLKAEAKKLNDKRKAMENKVEWLTESLEVFLKASGKEERNVGMYSLGYRELPDRVKIVDESFLEDAYLVQQKPKPDKRGIKKALDDGEVVFGAELETGRTKFEVKK